MIETIGLSRVFRSDELETTALRDIDIRIESGEFVAIMGPSGCGKSTFLNVLGLLDRPTGGRYRFCDREVSQLGEDQRIMLRKGAIGFIFQNFHLADELTVYENVALPLVFMRVKPVLRRKQVGEVLERLKIGHRSRHFPQQLSGGQQQRVAIARALVTKPSLILADEPTGNLDSRHGIEVMKFLRGLNREGRTIVMVTHNLRDAEFAHRVVNLLDGQIISTQ